MRPGRGIGKQHLHIARPHLARIGTKGGPGVAGDAADNLQRVSLIEPRRGQPFAVVDDQRHLGKVAGGAGGCPGKDHVFHAVAAHGRCAVFAHDPAQRLQQVGFAAAIGADHAGQPVADQQVGRVDKAFEAVKAQPGEAQRPGPDSIKPPWWQQWSSSQPPSTACRGHSRHIHKMLRVDPECATGSSAAIPMKGIPLADHCR